MTFYFILGEGWHIVATARTAAGAAKKLGELPADRPHEVRKALPKCPRLYCGQVMNDLVYALTQAVEPAAPAARSDAACGAMPKGGDGSSGGCVLPEYHAGQMHEYLDNDERRRAFRVIEPGSSAGSRGRQAAKRTRLMRRTADQGGKR